MIGAELDTRRRELGLTARELAEMLGISERTISYRLLGEGRWDDPAQVRGTLVGLEDAMEEIVEFHLDKASALAERAVVPMTRYRTQAELDASPHAGLPLGAHAMALAWTAAALRAKGHSVQIEWAK